MQSLRDFLDNVEIQPGDVFASQNPQGIGPIIQFWQKFNSKDNKSDRGHTGIIQNDSGKTLEAVFSITEQNLMQKYNGCGLTIARPVAVEDELVHGAIEMLRKQHLGQGYPYWRLVFHLFRPLAKYITADGRFVVCSELTAKYLWLIGKRHAQFTGTTPDDLVDEWRKWRDFEIIFDGKLEIDLPT